MTVKTRFSWSDSTYWEVERMGATTWKVIVADPAHVSGHLIADPNPLVSRDRAMRILGDNGCPDLVIEKFRRDYLDLEFE